MSLPARDRPWTLEDLEAIPDDGFRHELQAGLLLSEPLPGTRHGRIAMRIGYRLEEYVRRHPVGVVVSNDSAFVLAKNPDTVRGPDVAFIARERFERSGDSDRPFPGAPDLAVEVLSPSNTPEGIRAKVADYLAAGTRQVWVVDPGAKTITAYASLLSPVVHGGDDRLRAEDLVPGFELRVGEVFEI